MTVKIEMEMPTCCDKCKFMLETFPQCFCFITDYWIVEKSHEKPSWCPLQEVKE